MTFSNEIRRRRPALAALAAVALAPALLPTAAAQTPPAGAPPVAARAAPVYPDAFADSLAGAWAGTLYSWGPRGEQTVSMQLDIARADTAYTFTVIYGEDDRRAYRLLVRDGAAGRYAIDEGAGLIIDSFRRGDALVSAFTVGENRVLATYERTRDAAGPLLRFEVIGTVVAPIGRGELPNGDPLLVYDVAARQRALLRPVPPAAGR